MHPLFSLVAPALVFVLAVIPTSLVLRWFRKDPLRRSWDKTATTYWVARTTPPGPMTNRF